MRSSSLIVLALRLLVDFAARAGASDQLVPASRRITAIAVHAANAASQTGGRRVILVVLRGAIQQREALFELLSEVREQENGHERKEADDDGG